QIVFTGSDTATGLPTNGSEVWIRVVSGYVGPPCSPVCTPYSVNSDFTYTAAGAVAASMSSPAPGATLSGSTQSFSWTAGTGAVSYTLTAGSSAGASNY